MPEPDEDDGWQTVNSNRDEDDEELAAWGVETPEADTVHNDERDEELNFIATFDPRWRNDFEGLAYIGHLEGAVSIPYHTFKVRTLTSGEKIAVTSMVQPLENSVGYARAYRAAIAAAGLILVDGKPLLTGSKQTTVIAQKYQYIIDNWHDYIIDILYDKVNELEGRVLKVPEELGIYEVRKEIAQVEAAVATSQPEE